MSPVGGHRSREWHRLGARVPAIQRKRSAGRPRTRASGDHTRSGEGTDFRFDLNGDPIGFADLQWLPIPIPGEGGGPGEVVVRSENGRAFVELREAVVAVRDSRMDGGMVIELMTMFVVPVLYCLKEEVFNKRIAAS